VAGHRHLHDHVHAGGLASVEIRGRGLQQVLLLVGAVVHEQMADVAPVDHHLHPYARVSVAVPVAGHLLVLRHVASDGHDHTVVLPPGHEHLHLLVPILLCHHVRLQARDALHDGGQVCHRVLDVAHGVVCKRDHALVDLRGRLRGPGTERLPPDAPVPQHAPGPAGGGDRVPDVYHGAHDDDLRDVVEDRVHGAVAVDDRGRGVEHQLLRLLDRHVKDDPEQGPPQDLGRVRRHLLGQGVVVVHAAHVVAQHAP